MHPGSQTANFRISTIPSAQGEKTLIRTLAVTRKKTILKMEKRIISQTILQPLKRLTQNPNGIIFVNEPTGSGKTGMSLTSLKVLGGWQPRDWFQGLVDWQG